MAGSEDEGDVNGNGNRARFYFPYGLWFDEKHQSLLVCDRFNNKLKRVSMKGILDLLSILFYLSPPSYLCFFNLIPSSSSSSWLNLQIGDVSTVVYRLDGARFVTIANTSILISSDCGQILRVTEPGNNSILHLPPSISPPSPLSLSTHSSLRLGEARVIQQHTERGEAKECEFNKGLRGLAVDEETTTAFVVNRDHHIIKKITFYLLFISYLFFFFFFFFFLLFLFNLFCFVEEGEKNIIKNKYLFLHS